MTQNDNKPAAAPIDDAEEMRDAAMRTVQAMGLIYTPGSDRWRPNTNHAPAPSPADERAVHALDCQYILDDNPWAICTCGKGSPNNPRAASASQPVDEWAAFEAWARGKGGYTAKGLEVFNGQYVDEHANTALDAWLAARAASANETGAEGAMLRPSFDERKEFEAPLIGRWHHGNGVLVCGSIRVAVESFDTQPNQEFVDQMFDWICETLNTAIAAPQPAQADARVGHKSEGE